MGRIESTGRIAISTLTNGLYIFIYFFSPCPRTYGTGASGSVSRAGEHVSKWMLFTQVDDEGLGVGGSDATKRPNAIDTADRTAQRKQGQACLRGGMLPFCQPPNLPTPSPLPPSPSLFRPIRCRHPSTEQWSANRKQGLAEWCGWMQASRAKTTGLRYLTIFHQGFFCFSRDYQPSGMSPHTSTTNPHPSRQTCGGNGRDTARRTRPGYWSGSSRANRRLGRWENNRGFPGDTARAACQRNLPVQILHYRKSTCICQGDLSS